MKLKKYYSITVARHDGETFSNPLRLGLGEAVLIGKN
jgi:hypothetical protein